MKFGVAPAIELPAVQSLRVRVKAVISCYLQFHLPFDCWMSFTKNLWADRATITRTAQISQR